MFLSAALVRIEGEYPFIIGISYRQLFSDGGLYHINARPLLWRANQWTGFYMIGTSVMKELNLVPQ